MEGNAEANPKTKRGRSKEKRSDCSLLILSLRPVYHHLEERCDGLLPITVLAYQAVQLIRRKLAEHGIHESWASLREMLGQ